HSNRSRDLHGPDDRWAGGGTPSGSTGGGDAPHVGVLGGRDLVPASWQLGGARRTLRDQRRSHHARRLPQGLHQASNGWMGRSPAGGGWRRRTRLSSTGEGPVARAQLDAQSAQEAAARWQKGRAASTVAV